MSDSQAEEYKRVRLVSHAGEHPYVIASGLKNKRGRFYRDSECWEFEVPEGWDLVIIKRGD